MRSMRAALLLLFTASPNRIAAQTTQNSTAIVNWAPCPQQNATTPTQCGTLIVPLDYTDASRGTLDLQLVKVSAVNQPRKGSILFNPGGPGDSGRDIVGEFGDSFLIATGGYHDLIGFDPRGTGYTIPFSCYNTTIARTIARLPFPTLTNASDTALGEVWAGRQAFAEACDENAAEYADVLGTAFVARDMLRIAEALDDDGLLRYWGFSYGTVLGATTAAMFPDKIDRMVLDGVVNSHQWYGGSAIEGVVQADAVLDGFFESCISNPGQCPLAQDSNSAEGLSQTFYTFLDTLKYNPIIIGDDPSTDLINYSLVKGLTFGAMYTPSLWPILAIALHTLLGGNITAIAEVFDSFGLSGRLSSDPFSPATPDALYGIQCGDTSLRSNNLTSLRAIIDPTVANSRLAGESFVVLEPLSCAPWPFFAKERYSGDFQAQTRSPIVFVGGPFDPVTPLVSARNISAGFDGSVVLQHNGYGHTSLGQASLCTAKNIRAYFRDGVLPSAGTVCSPDQVLFTNETTVQTLEPLLANVTKRAYSDDAHLLRAITHLSKNVRFGRRV